MASSSCDSTNHKTELLPLVGGTSSVRSVLVIIIILLYIIITRSRQAVRRSVKLH